MKIKDLSDELEKKNVQNKQKAAKVFQSSSQILPIKVWN